MNRKNEYTDTVRDLKAMVRREADDEKRRELSENLDKMAAQLERQRDQLGDLKVLTERVDGLTWLVRGVIVLFAVEAGAGVFVALLLKGHP
jgi:nitrogen fixation/metabolism regulation signal transduction histidine kinase